MRITVTLARQLGCGGSLIGQMIADNLQIRCLDREIVSQAAHTLSLDEEDLAAREERGTPFWERMLKGISVGSPEALYQAPVSLSVSDRDLFEAETEVMKEIAAREDCVIVGRLASHVLRPHAGTVNILLHAPLPFRIRLLVERYGIESEARARAMITQSDETRKRYITQMLGADWGKPQAYHLCLDTSTLPLPDVGAFLTDFVRRRTG